MKELDLKKSVYDLTEQYPELIELLKEMGFVGIVKPIVRTTLGRATTIPQGSERQGKKLEEVIKILENAGFKVVPG